MFIRTNIIYVGELSGSHRWLTSRRCRINVRKLRRVDVKRCDKRGVQSTLKPDVDSTYMQLVDRIHLLRSISIYLFTNFYMCNLFISLIHLFIYSIYLLQIGKKIGTGRSVRFSEDSGLQRVRFREVLLYIIIIVENVYVIHIAQNIMHYSGASKYRTLKYRVSCKYLEVSNSEKTLPQNLIAFK